MGSTTQTHNARRVSHLGLIVSDQDKAVAFYGKALGTEVRNDQQFDMGGHSMRWLTIGLPGDDLEWSIMVPMAMPGQPLPKAGDNNMTVLEVGDVEQACTAWTDAGGNVVSPPEDLPWGRSAVARDPDGNPWNLVQPA